MYTEDEARAKTCPYLAAGLMASPTTGKCACIASDYMALARQELTRQFGPHPPAMVLNGWAARLRKVAGEIEIDYENCVAVRQIGTEITAELRKMAGALSDD